MVSQTEPDSNQTTGDQTTGDQTTGQQTASEQDAGLENNGADFPIVFFDGVCGLCNRFIDFLLIRDSRRLFRFAPLQGETADKLIHDERGLPDSTSQSSERLRSIVLLESDRQYRRSAAVVRILHRLGGGWSIAAGLLWVIPWPIRDAGYRFVAANRYRLFGKKDVCRRPTAAEREQFLP